MLKPGGSVGASSFITFANTSKSVLQFVYGNSPVASSTFKCKSGNYNSLNFAPTSDIPKAQTSALTS